MHFVFPDLPAGGAHNLAFQCALQDSEPKGILSRGLTLFGKLPAHDPHSDQ